MNLTRFLVAALFLTPLARGAEPSVRFSTFVGGNGYEIPMTITTDPSGGIYVAGLNGSADFPGAIELGSGRDGFVEKLSSNGSTVVYAATLGGFIPRAAVADAAGNLYLCGANNGGGLLVTGAIQGIARGGYDAVVMKLNPQGTQVLFATYLGGDADDAALGLAVDPITGAIWVSGVTMSTNFPTAGQPYQAALGGEMDAFLARLSNDGSVLEYATYFGGESGQTMGRGLALDARGRPVMCGRTTSAALPVLNAFQSAPAGASEVFLTKFEANGRALVFSTFVGGSGADTAASVGLDNAGNIYLHGYTTSPNFPSPAATPPEVRGYDDVFVAKFNTNASALIYTTVIGTSEPERVRQWPNGFGPDSATIIDIGGMAVSPSGQVFVAGSTQGGNLTGAGALKAGGDGSSDAFAFLLEPNGDLNYSTYLGGLSHEHAYAAARAPDGGFLLTGWTTAGTVMPDFPSTPGSAQPAAHLTGSEAYVMRLDLQAPPLGNDSFSGAAAISGLEMTLVAQTAGASKENGEPDHAGNAGGKSVWYRWTAPVSGKLIITARGSSFPAVFALYQGTALNNLQTLAASDTEIRRAVVAGQSYLIAAAGKDGASGTLYLSLTVSIPPNDDFADRTLITGSTATVLGSNVGSTSEANDAAPRTVWWKWTAPVTGAFTLSTLGSDFDTWLYIYTGPAPGSLTELYYNRAYTNFTSRLTFPAQAGVEYQFMVYGEGGETGQIQLNLSPATRPPNDDFVNRVRLLDGNGLVSKRNETVTGHDFDAVIDAAESALQSLTSIQYPSGRMIWWEWTAPIDGAVSISTTNSRAFDNPDQPAGARIVVFAGDTFPTNVSALYFSDSAPNRATTLFVTDVRAGTRYQIGLDAVDWEQPVQYSLKIVAIAPPKIVLSSAQILAGEFRARVEGIEGRDYRVRSTTNFVQFETVTNVFNIPGDFTFRASAAPKNQFFLVEEVERIE